ncbi:MAG: alpha/beta hydrolase [Ruminococcus sp.]|nr:alpha/beta hydrolase [Ruminococcus sp.]
MIFNMYNGSVTIGNSEMYYASFGTGSRTVVVIPGLSDGLTTVEGKALLLIKPYLRYLSKYTVYMFSRKDPLPAGTDIRQMAEDQAEAMRILGIGKAYVTGVSQGGMIAQYLAADHPELVEKLALVVTAPCVNDTIRDNIERWKDFAMKGDHASLMKDTAEKTYSDGYLRRNRLFLPFLRFVGKQKDYSRFLVNAHAILGFDATEDDSRISCPTLIISGDSDKTVGTSAGEELHRLITGSEFYTYKGLGHGLYEESRDFYRRVFDFFSR